MIDIAALQTAREFLQQIQFFQRAVRRGQHADGVCAVLGLYIGQPMRRIFKRGLPIGRAP